ncbi:hypothetical protein ABLA30_05155 [Xenorhabdus nematophila]|uniref:Uncharacterized protein n=1 Tax=Xenorhabdus nematophila (strain ATCC 19061 / DSM 3370 / CCUG 14189 / LMG 1036 / NCIMB 9965 / AN6) TaxID=406817 RepID=D3VKL8_XENNA|nr:hypothetical protein [Xenorhabdus nematophila]CBJ91126.1 conserved hypothetical protein [Xenorhabdus nematophila ATCC 19061]
MIFTLKLKGQFMFLNPNDFTGRSGGLFQEVDPDGNEIFNFVVVGDNRKMPQTMKHGHQWKPVNVLPAGAPVKYYDD